MTVIRGKLPKARPEKPAKKPPSRVAQMIALAHLIEDLVESGWIASYSEAARLVGITSARMSQVCDLVLLSPDMQEDLLFGRGDISAKEAQKLVRSRFVEEL